jgi:hypothetical protein
MTMRKRSNKVRRKRLPPTGREELAFEAAAAVPGGLGGAAVGAFAGPVGAVVGAAIGAMAGAAAGKVASDVREVERAREERLDEEIGVMHGSIGAAPKGQPPAQIGAYSAGSAGAGKDVEPPVNEGPIPRDDEG